jgi:hypothetical protein
MVAPIQGNQIMQWDDICGSSRYSLILMTITSLALIILLVATRSPAIMGLGTIGVFLAGLVVIVYGDEISQILQACYQRALAPTLPRVDEAELMFV